MVDDHMVAIPVTRVAGHFYDRTVGGRIDQRPLWRGKVKSGVEFSGFIDRVDPVTEAGCDPAAGSLLLTGWMAGVQEQQLLVLFLMNPSICA